MYFHFFPLKHFKRKRCNFDFHFQSTHHSLIASMSFLFDDSQYERLLKSKLAIRSNAIHRK